jgi:hypothetical protein
MRRAEAPVQPRNVCVCVLCVCLCVCVFVCLCVCVCVCVCCVCVVRVCTYMVVQSRTGEFASTILKSPLERNLIQEMY